MQLTRSLYNYSVVFFAGFSALVVWGFCTPDGVHGVPDRHSSRDRILFNYFPAFVARLPVIAGEPNAQVVTWTLADMMLAGLSLWDWRAHRRMNVFPPVVGPLLAYHLFTANAHHFGAWRSFGKWLFGL